MAVPCRPSRVSPFERADILSGCDDGLRALRPQATRPVRPGRLRWHQHRLLRHPRHADRSGHGGDSGRDPLLAVRSASGRNDPRGSARALRPAGQPVAAIRGVLDARRGRRFRPVAVGLSDPGVDADLARHAVDVRIAFGRHAHLLGIGQPSRRSRRLLPAEPVAQGVRRGRLRPAANSELRHGLRRARAVRLCMADPADHRIIADQPAARLDLAYFQSVFEHAPPAGPLAGARRHGRLVHRHARARLQHRYGRLRHLSPSSAASTAGAS